MLRECVTSEKSSGHKPSELQNSRFVHHSTFVVDEGVQSWKNDTYNEQVGGGGMASFENGAANTKPFVVVGCKTCGLR